MEDPACAHIVNLITVSNVVFLPARRANLTKSSVFCVAAAFARSRRNRPRRTSWNANPF